MKYRLLFLLITLFSCGYAEEEYQFHGSHFLASYMDCDEEALNDVDALRSCLLQAAEECGAHVLSSTDYRFSPCGFTMAILLSESHASIHTYPEHRACFVDLFTCGQNCSSARFTKILENYLKPKTVCKKQLVRNTCIEEE